MRPLRELAARLETIASWMEEEVSAGAPPRAVAQTVAEACRETAATARADDQLEAFRPAPPPAGRSAIWGEVRR